MQSRIFSNTGLYLVFSSPKCDHNTKCSEVELFDIYVGRASDGEESCVARSK